MINVLYLCHWIKWERSFIQPLPTFISSVELLIWEKKEGEQKKKKKQPGVMSDGVKTQGHSGNTEI